MPTSTGQPAKPQAITDLYNEQQGSFLVQYPILLVLGIALTGVAAFAVTGFLGYPGDTGFSSVFAQPWVLFLWMCALLITLQASIFRDKSLRSRLILSLVVSALAIVLVGITYFSKSLPDIIRELLNNHKLLATVATNGFTYAIINFGLLAIFWVDTVRRWIRRARGQALSPQINIGIETRTSKGQEDEPSLTELISGDLIAGAVLALLLAGLFWGPFLPQFIHPVDAAGKALSINECQLSWPFGACILNGTHVNPPTLTFINIFQTLLYLPLGLLILALSATLSGLGAVGGVDEAYLQQDPHLVVPSATERAGAAPIAEDVAITVVDTLKAALNRRARSLGNNVMLSLRTVVWPCLLVIAVYAIAQTSTAIEGYLHTSDKNLQAVATWVLPAAGFGLAAILASVISPALIIFRLRIVENTLRFLGLIGFIVLLSFWLFSLALTLIDMLLNFTGATQGDDRRPFFPPSYATYISFGALLLFGLFFVLRRGRSSQRAPTAEVATSRASQVPGEAGTRPRL